MEQLSIPVRESVMSERYDFLVIHSLMKVSPTPSGDYLVSVESLALTSYPRSEVVREGS
jgi:hypothetical protein